MVQLLVGLYLLLLALVVFVWVGIGLLAASCAHWPWLSRWLPLPEGFGERRDDPQVRMDYSLPAQAAERTYRPSVALIVSARGGDAEQLGVLLSTLTYPAVRLEIHVIAPGSLDRYRAELRGLANVTFHDSADTRRRDMTVNRVVALARGEILVFMDSRAAVVPDALQLLIRHFAHPRVVCVAAERRLCEGVTAGGFAARLRCFDARMWTIAGPFSELFAMRATFFEPTESDPLVEDFRLAGRLASKEVRSVRETNALVPLGSSNHSDQIALCTARLRAVLRPGVLWRFGRHGISGFSHWSHRVLRYIVAPLAFFLAIPLGAALAFWYPWLWIPVVLQLVLVGRALYTGRPHESQGQGPCWVLQFVGTAGAALAGMVLLVSGRTAP